MSSLLVDIEYPIYKSLTTKKEYVCKNDIFAYYNVHFDAISEKYNKPLPTETTKFLESYEDELAGTCEFVLASEWLAARYEYEDFFKMVNSNKSLFQAVCQDGMLYDCLLLKTSIEDIMKNRPEVLLPYKKESTFKAVRLFKDGKNAFSMVDELESAVNGASYNQDPMTAVDTVDFRTVMEASKESKFEILVLNVGESTVLSPTLPSTRCEQPAPVPSESTSSEEKKSLGEKSSTSRRNKNKKKKVVNTPKMSETSDDELPAKTATTTLSEVEEATKLSDSANSSEKSDAEEVPIRPAESTSTCQKCFRTSEYCKKAKEQLKTSQNLVKKLEKKQSETEKLMEEMKKKMQEEMDALKLQMEQLKNANEQQKLENQKQVEKLKKENEELKVENAKLKEATASTLSTPEEPPLTQKERVQLIREFQEKKMELQGSQIYSQTELKVLRLIGTKPDIQKMVQYDHINFKAQFHTYLRVLGTTLNELQNNEKISRSQIPALPVYPAMSERFNTEFQKMMDEENKKLDEECMICTEVVDKKKLEDVFTCPVCQNSIHLCCVERWFQRSQTCPCCRTEWN